jgi:hypothetical protein
MLTPLLAACILYQAQTPAPMQHYVPTQTKVAIMPTFNTSAEKWKNLRDRQQTASNDWLNDQFTKRGFQVIPVADVQAQITATKIDFTDEEQINKANIYKVGEACGADVVVLSVVVDTRQEGSGFLQTGYGHATMKSWLLDVKTKSPIISGHSSDARSARIGPSTADRQVWAVPLALNDTFKDFFAVYPLLKK